MELIAGFWGRLWDKLGDIFLRVLDKAADGLIFALPMIGAGIVGYFKFRYDARLAARALEEEVKRAAGKVEVKVQEVKSDLAESSSKQNVKLETIHLLVNSQMGAQKRMLAITARAKAEITNAPNDLAEAERAEREYDEHRAQQTKVDEISPKPTQ